MLVDSKKLRRSTKCIHVSRDTVCVDIAGQRAHRFSDNAAASRFLGNATARLKGRNHLREDSAILHVLMQILKLYDSTTDDHEQLLWAFAGIDMMVFDVKRKILKSVTELEEAQYKEDPDATRRCHKDTFLPLFNNNNNNSKVGSVSVNIAISPQAQILIGVAILFV